MTLRPAKARHGSGIKAPEVRELEGNVVANLRVLALLASVIAFQVALLAGGPALPFGLLCAVSTLAAIFAAGARLHAGAAAVPAATALLAGGGVWLAATQPETAAAVLGLVPVAGFGLLACVFTHTLLSGREPMVTRFIREDVGVLNERLRRHGRRLTLLWTLLLAAAFAQLAVAAIFALDRPWPAVLLAGNTMAMAAFFLWQHRQARHYRPAGKPASAWNTLKVMTSPGFWRNV